MLVVDDELLYAEAISVLLDMNEGIDVVGIAGDGRAAVEQAESLRPDLVLMDVEMPVLDGIAAAGAIAGFLWLVPSPVATMRDLPEPAET